ncbi:MAG: DUF2911 domain-containing protein [Flavobacteriales bacterium]|nr:DUF2911 domain-containing protein [Flavobacteriales bacterium]
MLKKVLITVGLLVLIAVIGLLYLTYRNRSMSPPDEQRITTTSGLDVRINYSRPSVRDRLIFGPEEQEALQAFGKYWRLGANEATVMEFSAPVRVAGYDLKAGTYGVYAVPGPDSFQIGFNTTWDRWGYEEPDYSQDAASFMVPIEGHEHVEQFTIHLGETDNGVRIICEWDDVRFVIPVQEVK